MATTARPTTSQTAAMNGRIGGYPSPSPLATRTDLTQDEVKAVTEAVNPLVADAFALYVKTKNFHWHLAGSLSWPFSPSEAKSWHSHTPTARKSSRME